MREFHISRKARDFYRFDAHLFSLNGNVIFADLHAVRTFAQTINEKKDPLFPEKSVSAGDLNAMGLIDEILHFIVALYREQKHPAIMAEGLEWLEKKTGKVHVDQCLKAFMMEFPPLPLYRNEVDAETYFSGQTEGIPNRQILLEEMLMLWLANKNPACSAFDELFDDDELEKHTAYNEIMLSLEDFFDVKSPFGPDNQNLIQMLRSPAVAVPHSLPGQLEYILERWAHLLGKLLFKLLRGLDVIREEKKARFDGTGVASLPDFHGMEGESAKYSQDLEWMSRLVLLAKNAYVWMDQLSKKYRTSINRLDQIPEEELSMLARWGFTGLWLIGIWERSVASKRIKQLCGNPEAEASAYSLYDYQIASDLGGEKSFLTLKSMAWKYGIRMAGDMVPNHMGIYSKWVVEHPDWFIALSHIPFPAYRFSGANLSPDERLGLYIEDHYYDHTDAAVVFKRVEHRTGETRYIYHGNDGTRMPWNDTAQLNYLKPEVREAVIQTILHVARLFSIIRFDAAMTLARRHYQRLWFPEPGTGGDIPSRSEHGMTRDDFNRNLPGEFWREVVDRIAAEAPDTLLLAEAFWLLEGYFVRTLGMHRVYNSAFMNMLRDENNAGYRQVIKNTLEFDPQILKRFVNFMNNPDEETTSVQFGKGDKYFGICMLMTTMPGLPMFGHGQIEGLHEKYGMEFRRAYWTEDVDLSLVERHERQIFPLLRKRYLFADVDNFLLYDFFTDAGIVNEDVITYSNSYRNEKALVVYNNRYAESRGWIRTSVSYRMASTDKPILVQKSLAQGFALPENDNFYCIFRDAMTGNEYIRNCKSIHNEGLYITLSGYQAHVFIDFRVIEDNEWHHFGQVTSFLAGNGVPSIEEAMRELFLLPMHNALKELVHPDLMDRLYSARCFKKNQLTDITVIQDVKDKMKDFFNAIKSQTGSGDLYILLENGIQSLNAALRLPLLKKTLLRRKDRDNFSSSVAFLDSDRGKWTCIISWIFIHQIGKFKDMDHYPEIGHDWIDEWLLARIINGAFHKLGLGQEADRLVSTLRIMTKYQNWFRVEEGSPIKQILKLLLQDEGIRRYIGMNRHKDILWIHKESFDELLNWLVLPACIEGTMNGMGPVEIDMIVKRLVILSELRKISEAAGYRVDRMIETPE